MTSDADSRSSQGRHSYLVRLATEALERTLADCSTLAAPSILEAFARHSTERMGQAAQVWEADVAAPEPVARLARAVGERSIALDAAMEQVESLTRELAAASERERQVLTALDSLIHDAWDSMRTDADEYHAEPSYTRPSSAPVSTLARVAQTAGAIAATEGRELDASVLSEAARVVRGARL